MGNEGPSSHPYRAPAEVIVALRRIEISEGWRRGLVVVRQLREGIDRGDYDAMSREELSAIISDLVDERDRIRARVAPAAENGLALASAVFSVGGLIGLKVLPGSLLLACLCILLAASSMAARSFAQRWMEVVAEIEGAAAVLRTIVVKTRSLPPEKELRHLADRMRQLLRPNQLRIDLGDETYWETLEVVERGEPLPAADRPARIDPGPLAEGAAESGAEDVDEVEVPSDRKQRR